jgi:hypothetical protein
MEISGEPEVSFRVGIARASLWRRQIQAEGEKSEYWVTLDRAGTRSELRGEGELLHGQDIPQAILALKKAHDYIKRRPTQASNSEFLSADALIDRLR